MDNFRFTKISICEKQTTNFISKKGPILKEEFHANYKKCGNLLSALNSCKVVLSTLNSWKVNSCIMINILKEIGTILGTHRKESNPLFL